jgi:hypothetical protein
MQKLQLDKVQRYFDEASGCPLRLCFEDHEIDVSGVHVVLEGVPLLKNDDTGTIFYPNRTKQMIACVVDKTQKRRESFVRIHRRERHVTRYSYAEKFNFLYSDIDYEYIPGLTRPWDDGYLTPVFFNLSVLNKYTQHPGYRLDLFSNTYGTIWFGDQWTIDFGINRKKNVIMWLGDIARLPENEIYYLRSENIDSDHDIHSQFYNAQIEVEFAESSPQQEAIRERRALNDLVLDTFGWTLFHLEGEIDRVIANLNRPVFWQDTHIRSAIESLNRIFVESVNVEAVKAELKKTNPEIEVKSIKSLKSLQLWLTERLAFTNAEDLLCPFFVLYDYRILVCHLISDDKKYNILMSINGRLELPKDNSSNEAIYDALVSKLLFSIQAIKERVKYQQALGDDAPKPVLRE